MKIINQYFINYKSKFLLYVFILGIYCNNLLCTNSTLFISNICDEETRDSILQIFNNQSVEFLNFEKNIKQKIKKINPKYIIIIGKLQLQCIEQNEVYKINSDYFFSYIEDSLNPSIIVSRIPFESKVDILNYLLKYKNSLAIKKSCKNIITYDPYNYINNFNKIVSNSTFYTENKKWNIKNKIKFELQKNRSFIYSIINKTTPEYFVYVGHGSFYGWESNNKFNSLNIKNISKNLFFYNIDFSCSTGNWLKKEESFSEKLIKNINSGAISCISSSLSIPISEVNCLFNSFFLEFNLNQTIGENFLNFQKNIILNCDYNYVNNYNLLGFPY